MLKKLLVVGAVILAAVAGAVAVTLFAPEESAQASVSPQPMSVDVELIEAVAPVQIDPETGLPKGAVMFQAGDHTCLAVPGFDIECWCPCETGACAEVDTAVSEEITATVQYTDTTTIPTFPDDNPFIPGDEPNDEPGDEDAPEDTPEDEPEDIPEDTPDDEPEDTPEEEPEGEPEEEPEEPDEGDDEGEEPPEDEGDDDDKKKCNQGVGNGAEGCSPGNSDHNQPPNDEGEGDGPGSPGRGGGNGKGKGKGN